MPPGGLLRQRCIAATILLAALSSISIQILPTCGAELAAVDDHPAPEKQAKEDGGIGGWLGRGVDRVFALLVGECLEEEEDAPSRQRQQQGQCLARTDGGVPRFYDEEDTCNDDGNDDDSFPHTRRNFSRLKQSLYDPLEAKGRFVVGAVLGMLVSRCIAKALGRLIKALVLGASVLIFLVYSGIWDNVPMISLRGEKVVSFLRAATSTCIVSARKLWLASGLQVSLGGVASAALSETELVSGLIVGGVAGFVI